MIPIITRIVHCLRVFSPPNLSLTILILLFTTTNRGAEMLQISDPERYYDKVVAPSEPLNTICLDCGAKMYHNSLDGIVFCKRCGGVF